MLIDWFTVGAQIVNFLILVLLLRRFLYGPIVRAMEAREARIAAQAAEAAATKEAAEAEAAAYRAKSAELDEQRDAVLSAAKGEAESWRKEHLAQVRAELEEARTGWYRGIQAEQSAFLRSVRERLARQVCDISRRALADMADAELEERMIAIFLRRLRDLSPQERERLTGSAVAAGRPLAVRSAFAIPSATRQQIAETLHADLAATVELEFEQEPALVCGVELRAHDHKVAWTLDDYLDALEADLLERLDGELGNGELDNGAPVDGATAPGDEERIHAH